MVLSRRLLVVAAPWLLARPVGAAAGLRLETAPGGMAALTGPGVRRALLLPGDGARLLAPLACGGEVLTVVTFEMADGTREDGGARMAWAALAVALDAVVTLLALEPLAWQSGAARMGTRLVSTGDRLHVLCRRETAVPAGPTFWRREAWTDTLAWTAPVGLADAPVRAPLPGTRQHVVAGLRARAATVVATGPAALTPALLAEAKLGAGALRFDP